MEKTFIGLCEGAKGKLWGFHIKVPHDITNALMESTGTRVICSIGEDVSFHCALLPNGPGKRRYVLVNKEHRKKLKLKEGDEVEIVLKSDESKYGMPLPEEVEELLYQDPEFDRLFHLLTPGKQRSLLYMVGKPKSSNIRLTKAVILAEYLKDNNGKIDFLSLNQAFKDRKNDFF